MTKIWLDDERPKPNDDWIQFRSSSSLISYLTYRIVMGYEVPEAISLDHDLGEDDTSREVVLWLCENDYWPTEVFVHTQNPVGREWLVGMAERYGPGVSHRE